jgi:hypothetical protein
MPMVDEQQQQTQKTAPKKGEPIDIPVPEREDVADAFERLAKADDPDAPKRSDARRASK